MVEAKERKKTYAKSSCPHMTRDPARITYIHLEHRSRRRLSRSLPFQTENLVTIVTTSVLLPLLLFPRDAEALSLDHKIAAHFRRGGKSSARARMCFSLSFLRCRTRDFFF